MLEVKNLKVKIGEKDILKGVNFDIKKGETQAILGPNASGKSTFVQVIAGNPKYKIAKGEILFLREKINNFPPEKRVKSGIVLAWQSPPAIKGVKFSQLLERISFGAEYEKEKIGNLLSREVNLDFSGGEKKISELWQIISLKPKLAIFDEIDSGLDLKKIEMVSKIIKKELVDKKIAVLIITHSGTILNFLKPDITNVMVGGRIICRAKDFRKVLKTIKKYGYEKCKRCK